MYPPARFGYRSLVVLTFLFSSFFTCSVNAQWSQVGTDAQLNAADVRGIAISNGILYAGTFGFGVFRSADQGNTWSKLDEGLKNEYVSNLASTHGRVFAWTSGSGVYRLSDDGAAWIDISNDVFAANGFKALHSRGGNIFMGTVGSGVYFSSDNGLTWSTRNTGLPFAQVLSITSMGQDLYVGVKGAGVFKSSDDGVTWTSASAGLPDSEMFGVAALAAIGTRLFAGSGSYGGPSGLFMSSDAGQTWTSVEDNLPPATHFPNLISVGASLIAGSSEGAIISSDFGSTWASYSEGMIGNGRYVNAFTVDNAVLYAGTEGGGLWKRALEGSSVQQYTHRAVAQVYPNPTIGSTKLQTELRRVLQIQLVTASGAVIWSASRSANQSGEIELNWILEGVAAGRYLMYISSADEFEVVPVAIIQ